MEFMHELNCDPVNADNETPDKMDAYIASVPDPDLQSQLCREKYLTRLRDGAWGGHVVLSAMCNMFGITINVLHATKQTCTVITNTPSSGVSTTEVNIGLILQYHYLGLDKVRITDCTNSSQPVETAPSRYCNMDSTTNSSDNDDSTKSHGSNGNGSDDLLDDASIEQGDEHTRHITGGPQANMMAFKNP